MRASMRKKEIASKQASAVLKTIIDEVKTSLLKFAFSLFHQIAIVH